MSLSFYFLRKSLSVLSHIHICDFTKNLLLTSYFFTKTVFKKSEAGRNQSELRAYLFGKIVPSTLTVILLIITRM